MMNEKNNVVVMDDFRKFNKVNLLKRDFKRYLKNLASSDLNYEATQLLKNLDDTNCASEALNKMAILMDELSMRVDNELMAKSIRKFSQNIHLELEKIDDAFKNQIH
jgi:hypothetical protein